MTENLLKMSNTVMLPASFIVAGWFGINWVLDIKKDTEINAMEISSQKAKQQKIIDKLDRSNERLAKIEEALMFIKDKLNK